MWSNLKGQKAKSIPEMSDAALDYIGEAGYDPVYGARPLKRAIQSGIENQLAQKILSGDYSPGDTIVIDIVGGLLSFDKKKGTYATMV